MTRRAGLIVLITLAAGAWLVGPSASTPPARAADDAPTPVTDGLIALYDFADADGDTVRDRSGVAPPLNLRIADTSAVRRTAGTLTVHGKTVIRSDGPASKLIERVQRTGEITIEAWITPANTKQEGPARIVTLSGDTSHRNFTLGQEADAFDVRLRTQKTSTNGMPSLPSPSKTVTTQPMHVVYTRERNGQTRLYLDGKQRAHGAAGGDASNWSSDFRFALANEMTGDRPWLGVYHRVAVYERALSSDEVGRNHRAGAAAVSATVVKKDAPAMPALTPALRLAEAKRFDDHVAPLLAKHCLECHGWGSTKAGLDLTTQAAAFKGGKHGPAVVPGAAAKSVLWDEVESDNMPDGAPPLTAAEKRVLREWIEAGAVWSDRTLAEADYAPRRIDGATWVRRLTVPEYVATVRVAVGVDIADEAEARLPRDVRADGFTNTAYNLTVDLAHVEAYARLARSIVERMDAGAFAARFTDSKALDPANRTKLITAMGKRLLRGPLSADEVASFDRVMQAVIAEGGDFDEAAAYAVEAMLQSPRFIYRIERSGGDEKAVDVGPHEMAARLSYTIWGAPPDDALTAAADAGRLATLEQVAQQARRMLDDPRAVARSMRFVSEWLNLGRLEHMRPNRQRFPLWNDQLAADMRAETLAFAEHVLWTERRPMTDLFNAQVAFLTGRLARHYGLEPRGHGLARYDVAGVAGRGGLLTQGSVLTIGGDEASMVTRGLFVLNHVLDASVDDPPPCVDTTPVATRSGLTNRGVAEQRIANNQCGACHGRFEPLAFGLEKFDGLGAYHERDEHGNALRDDGVIRFPGDDRAVKYESADELMDLLARSERVRRTVVRKMVQYAIGRPLRESDDEAVLKIDSEATANGGTYAAVMTAIVTSDLVRKTAQETQR